LRLAVLCVFSQGCNAFHRIHRVQSTYSRQLGYVLVMIELTSNEQLETRVTHIRTHSSWQRVMNYYIMYSFYFFVKTHRGSHLTEL